MSQLISLNCEMNRLSSLTLTGCSRLSSLYCRNNRLDRLDLSDNRALEFIETFDNLLTEIDVTHLEDLRFLHIDHNRLTHLDMSQNRKLEGGGFVARNNFVETILLPDQPGLTVYLDDYNEQDPIDGFDKVEWYLDAEHTIPAPETLEAAGQMLYRCAGSPAVERGAELDGFADAGKISAWARDAMEWACASGILNGDGAGQLRPQSDCTRAEVSAMLARFVNQII